MKVNPINNQNFEAKKFRIPVKTEIVKDGDFVKAKKLIVREYSNPNAEKLWNKALSATDADIKQKYLTAMGKFKLIDVNLNKTIANAVNNFKS